MTTSKHINLAIGITIIACVIVSYFAVMHVSLFREAAYRVNMDWAVAWAVENTVLDRYAMAWDMFNSTENRTLARAEALLVGNIDNLHEPSLYLLARVYMAQQDTEAVIAAANVYLDVFPENKRMHYLRGLAQGYEENFDQAIDDFQTFIAYAPDEWAGYLDLSWVYFQNGQMSQSQQVISDAIDRFPDNAWLESAYSVILHNQGNEKVALYYAERALQHAQSVSAQDWRRAYSANDPRRVDSDLADFIGVLNYNLALITNPQSYPQTDLDISEIGFVDQSPSGLRGGLHVSACHSSCPAENDCGDINSHKSHGSGYGSQCVKPPLPPYGEHGALCVAVNICGQETEGKMVCGVCSAVPESVAVPSPISHRRVARGGEAYLYYANEIDGDIADRCWHFENESGNDVFIPTNTRAEYEAFINAEISNADSPNHVTGLSITDVTTTPTEQVISDTESEPESEDTEDCVVSNGDAAYESCDDGGSGSGQAVGGGS